MAVNRITIKEQLKDWALNITDLDDDAINSFIMKNKWLQKGSKKYLNPTFNQLTSFASKFHVPFGNLLLDTPPEMESIRVAFRTKQNAPVNTSLTVRDVIYEMQRKQAWFKDESGLANKRIDCVGKSKNDDINKTLQYINNLINITHFNTPRELFNYLRKQLSKIGIINVQKGGAGLGTNRPIDVDELRAFVMLDDYAPLIFINQKDSYTARIFSLVHEFIHIVRGSDELLGGKDRDVREERVINKIVSNFLMPKQAFINQYKKNGELMKTAKYFNVSPQSAAIRAKELSIITDLDGLDFESSDYEPNKKNNGGGNPYNNALSMNDPRYMEAVVLAQVNGTVQPTQAASLIGISYKMLDKTVQTFNEREEFV